MNSKKFTSSEAKKRMKECQRVHMKIKRAKSVKEVEEIRIKHKIKLWLTKDMEELKLTTDEKIERQRLRDSQEKLFRDDGSKLEKQEQLQSDLVHWLEMNPISNPSFWKVYEKLRECEVRIMSLTKGHQYGGGSGGLKEFSTFNLKTE